jgi:hypothetical protein
MNIDINELIYASIVNATTNDFNFARDILIETPSLWIPILRRNGFVLIVVEEQTTECCLVSVTQCGTISSQNGNP